MPMSDVMLQLLMSLQPSYMRTDEDVVMRLEGRLAELMVKVDPSLYRKYITTSGKGEPILYVKMHKALYGMMRSALLFYRKLVGDLEAYGFKINPYNPCVANMDINGSQMTVVWHVDDLKVSHKKAIEITKLAMYLDDIYPGLKVHRGKIHDYLGMNPVFQRRRKCQSLHGTLPE